MSTQHGIPDEWRQFALFAGLEPCEREALCQAARRKTVAARRPILKAEHKGVVVCLLLSGKVKVYLDGSHGRRRTLGVLQAGALLGEVSAFDGGAYSAHVVALEKCEVLEWRQEDFLSLLRDTPQFHLNISRVMAERLRRNGELLQLDELSINERVARQLVTSAEREGQAASDGSITVRLSQQELSEMIGASREKVNKALAFFKRKQWVEQGHRRVVVRDLAALREFGWR